MKNNLVISFLSLKKLMVGNFVRQKLLPVIALMVFCALSANSHAQIAKKRITGKVIDEKGVTIPGATVLVKGTTTGTITDIDGNFIIDVPTDAKTIVVSFVGYTTREIALTDQTAYSIALQDASIGVSEVVVVGYGTQKKESVVGAISQVGTESLVKSGTGNVTNAIAGKLSGVLTIQQTGQPGQNGSEIIIRGLSSWNGSQPLVLVDGVERDFANLDPNEINTLSVLKDASATAVFGARGANGVIIVTTKRGVVGKPELNVSASTGIDVPTDLPDHISSYTTMQMLNVAYKNKGLWDKLVSQNALNEYQNPSSRINSLQYPDNNWFDMFTKPFAQNQQANVNIRGGTKFVKYFASFGYLHEGDYFKGYNQGAVDTRYKNDRFNYRSNLDFAISPSTDIAFSLGGDVQITNGHKSSPWKSLYGASPAAYAAYFPKWVLDEVPDPDYPDASGIRYADNLGQYFENPYNQFYSGSFDKTLTSKLFTDISVNQKLDFITKGLSAKAKVSLSTSYKNLALTNSYSFPEYVLDYSKIGVTGVNPWFRVGQGNEVYTQQPMDVNIGGMLDPGTDPAGEYYTDLYYEFSGNYNRTFKKHTVTALALINFQQKNKNTEFAYYNAGLVGRATYDYANRYLLEMNLGYTGSERFAPGNRFGLFPSVAVGWLLSEEPFFKTLFAGIDKLKFRYSDGLVGSDKADERWLYMSSYSVSGNYIVEDKAANLGAQWEMARKRDLGFELALFKNQLRINADFYDEYREKMLLTRYETFLLGNSFKQSNLGEMKKHGLEFEIEYNHTTASKLNYFVKSNFGFNENRIVYKDDLPYKEDYQKYAGTGYGGQLNGLELNGNGNGYFTSVDDLHLNPSPVVITASNVGDYQYVDYNADGIINTLDKHPVKGSLYPPVTYSLSGGFEFKGFEFNFMFQGNWGKYVNFNGAYEYEFLKGNLRVHQAQLDYWTPTNLNANHSTLNFEYNNDPKFSWAGGAADATDGYSGMLMGRTWRNADYIRLKEVYMGYTFKTKALQNAVGLDKINVYVTGNNLLTFTKLIEGDPERKNYMDGFYPQMVTGKVGLKLTF